MHLYLIRHGQSHGNLPDWNGGNQDVALTDLGERQARALADWLPAEISKPDIIYSSTMQRARQTVAPIAAAYQVEPVYDDRIREIGSNLRDHSPFPNDALPEFGDFWGSERPFHPISGLTDDDVEAWIHFRARVGLFIEDIRDRHEEQTVLVVCHGGVIDVTFDHIFDNPIWRRCEVWTRNTAVTYLDYFEKFNRKQWRLYYHNRSEHLAGVV